MKKNAREATSGTNTSSQDAFTAHLLYASKTVATWPEWKRNVLAHTRPVRNTAATQCKLGDNGK